MVTLIAGSAAWTRGDITATQRLLFNTQHDRMASYAPDAALLALSHQAHFYATQGNSTRRSCAMSKCSQRSKRAGCRKGRHGRWRHSG
jgi:hypothetical protein